MLKFKGYFGDVYEENFEAENWDKARTYFVNQVRDRGYSPLPKGFLRKIVKIVSLSPRWEVKKLR